MDICRYKVDVLIQIDQPPVLPLLAPSPPPVPGFIEKYFKSVLSKRVDIYNFDAMKFTGVIKKNLNLKL